MTVTLTPDLEQIIRERIEAGRYASADDVIADALIRLKQTDELEEIAGTELAELIAVGQADADRGDLVDSDEVFEELRRRSEARRGKAG